MAGVANFDAVPIGADQTSGRTPFASGTGSYARSWALTPLDPPDQTTHTRALPERVPSEVTTGDPLVYGKESWLDPATVSAGSPEPVTPRCSATSEPPLPTQ